MTNKFLLIISISVCFFFLTIFQVLSCMESKDTSGFVIYPFELDIRSVTVDTIKQELAFTNEKVNPVYDFTAQYPYFKVDRTNWNVGDQFQLKLKNIPDSMYVYLFNVDPLQNIKLLYQVYTADSVYINKKERKYIFPDKENAYTITSTGKEHFCIWLSKEPIKDINRYIEGLEMTHHPSFVMRIIQQIDNRLIPPNPHWKFANGVGAVGFDYDKQLFQKHPNGIIPLIIELEVPEIVQPKPEPTKVVEVVDTTKKVEIIDTTRKVEVVDTTVKMLPKKDTTARKEEVVDTTKKRKKRPKKKDKKSKTR